jgi:hypothetical protein
MRRGRRGLRLTGMSHLEQRQRAEQHATEAERLLARRFGFLDNTLKAQAHTTLAVYYATRAQAADSRD